MLQVEETAGLRERADTLTELGGPARDEARGISTGLEAKLGWKAELVGQGREEKERAWRDASRTARERARYSVRRVPEPLGARDYNHHNP